MQIDRDTAENGKVTLSEHKPACSFPFHKASAQSVFLVPHEP